MAKLVDPRDASHAGWRFDDPPTVEILKLGALLRIADALEDLSADARRAEQKRERKQVEDDNEAFANGFARVGRVRNLLEARFPYAEEPDPMARNAAKRVCEAIAWRAYPSNHDPSLFEFARCATSDAILHLAMETRGIGPTTQQRFKVWVAKLEESRKP